MSFSVKRLVHVSPLVFVAAFSLLLIIVSVFAVNNYRREKQLMLENLIRHSETVSRFIVSFSRNSFQRNINSSEIRSAVDLQKVIQKSMLNAIEEASEHPDIVSIQISDITGENILGIAGDPLAKDPVKYSDLTEQTDNFRDENVRYMMPLIDGKRYFIYGNKLRIPSRFLPGSPEELSHSHQQRRSRFEGGDDVNNLRSFSVILRNNSDANQLYIFLTIDIESASQAVMRQLVQILILSIVLLLVGVGGWLSLLTLQGLRGSQSQLKKIEDFSERLISTLPVGIITIDQDGYISTCNKAVTDIFKVNEDAFIGKKYLDILDEKLCRLIGAGFENPMTMKEEPSYNEITITDMKNGLREVLCCCMSVRSTENNGNTENVVLLLQDFSEINRLKNQLQRSERLAALGKVAAGVAHEIRNPLSSIKGLAYLIKKSMDNDSEGEMRLDLMVREIERLNRSITELLDFAKQDQLTKNTYDLCTIIFEAVELVNNDIAMKNIDIVTSCESVIIDIDGDKVKQVLLNLLLNAIQSVESQGRVNISLVLDGNFAVCTVEDSGAGIDEDVLGKVFDPYFTTKNNGSGLGLALSSKIIEAHQGTIKLENREQGGCIATLKLPC
jgi:two-component system sensor histidine kinase HydH